eukprot:gnl/TRDRNA2_/TRDRNA2_179538_c0_seq1.p1 gnl/TRDRNA2_/TRDRNA2_179538_c0~~gnl/TRDRNA2_/TRDRNA2_179538_c0_seq1.p1  ORF type:complete len:340 (+),score=88.77 gnl/TRDRNA2_/TRDRNA2_179538_c0_seq1:119-1138(+)
MALQFVKLAFLVIMASGLDVADVPDHVSLLQTSATVESRKIQRDSSSSLGDKMPTCPSFSAVEMAGVSCSDARQVNAHAKVDVHETVETTASEDQRPAAAKQQSEATIFLLRCFLNLVTFLFVVDIVLRLVSNTRSSKATATADVHALFRASELGNAAAVKELLDQGMSLQAEDRVGRTALHVAAKAGATEVVNLLLQRGADVDVTDSWDETPLHHAARAGAIDVCKSMLAYGAKVDALNVQDWTPLVAAASRGQKDACEWLLARGATQDCLPESSLPSMLQQLLKADEPDTAEEIEFPMPDLEAKLEADLLRRALEPKPEWEVESLPEWIAAVDYDDA